MVARTNRTATRRTVVALKAGGRLELADEAAVTLAMTTATLLDEAIATGEKGYAAAQLARVHLAAVNALTGKADHDNDPGLSDVIAALSTPMGNPEVT
jgi:hypothetical protein